MRDRVIHVPNPRSPAGRNFNWADIGLPHPDSPAGRNFDYSKYLGVQHPNSRGSLQGLENSGLHTLEYRSSVDAVALSPVFWKNIHDAIAMHSYTRVYGAPKSSDFRFSRYEEGNNYPDYPASNGELKVEVIATDNQMKIPGTLANRSHYGDLSVWHSMAPPGKHTNAAVREMIVFYAKHWYEKAQATGDLFTMGSIAHMVSDSYSQSHVVRSAQGITLFQSYIPQSGSKHRVADQLPMQRYQNEEGKAALDAVTNVLKMFRDKLAFNSDVEPFLRQKVYRIAAGRETFLAGGTDPRFAK
ncbi:MAG: hypothetical protein ACKVQK_04945 [Burkholderiales bacterium]